MILTQTQANTLAYCAVSAFLSEFPLPALLLIKNRMSLEVPLSWSNREWGRWVVVVTATGSQEAADPSWPPHASISHLCPRGRGNTGAWVKACADTLGCGCGWCFGWNLLPHLPSLLSDWRWDLAYSHKPHICILLVFGKMWDCVKCSFMTDLADNLVS